MDKTVAKFISFLTLVPVVALFVINILFQYDSSFFGEGYTWYAVSLLCLVIIPILAYPLKRVLPGYKEGVGKKNGNSLLLQAYSGRYSVSF